MMEVVISMIGNGRKVPLRIQPGDSVLRVKQRLEEKEGIPPARYSWIYKRRVLVDDEIIKDYSVTEGSVFHLFWRERGKSANSPPSLDH